MGLRDLKLPTETIQLPGGEFTVRGLSLSDISNLLRLHGEALEGVYLESIVNSDDDPEAFNMAALARTVMQAAPMAIAQAIAQAADEPDTADMVARLPIPVQMDAIEKVLALTFHTEDDVKNVVGAVLRGSGAVQRLLAGLNTPSANGSGNSVAALAS